MMNDTYLFNLDCNGSKLSIVARTKELAVAKARKITGWKDSTFIVHSVVENWELTFGKGEKWQTDMQYILIDFLGVLNVVRLKQQGRKAVQLIIEILVYVKIVVQNLGAILRVKS